MGGGAVWQMVYDEFCEAVLSMAAYMERDPYAPLHARAQRFIDERLRHRRKAAR